jgi:hypothetical protein
VFPGLVSCVELARCASIGHFAFSAHGENVRLIRGERLVARRPAASVHGHIPLA